MKRKGTVKKKEAVRKPKSRFLTIFVCVFLGFTVILGTTLGVVIGLRDARTLVSYGGVYLDEGEVSFLSSVYKTEYLASLNSSGVRAYDSKYFWQSKAQGGKTYGELFEAGLREYISGLLVASELYSSYGDYGRKEKAAVKSAAEQVLKYQAEGSKEKFNELASEFGFDYNDFLTGCELLYKTWGAKTLIYGENGENLEYYPDECERYIETYTHVSLLFVRTEEIFELDSEGNPVTENGEYVMRPLTDEEMAERETTVEMLRTAIHAKENGLDGQISPEMFEIYLKKSDGDAEMYDKGYYFNPAASETAAFYSYHPEIVDKAYEMEMGEYAEVGCSIGICFIYKYAVTEGAYADTDNQFFSDFYSDAASYLYALSLSELSDGVKFGEKYDGLDAVSIPQNSKLKINGF